jgi:8-oxo-dGTP pyrophosphatase MutT (NUDIX family)
VKRLEENKDKQLDEIKWDNYPISMGETTELCAGMMDKFGLSPAETVRMEIIEECGYDVPLDKIVPVRQYM